MSQPKLPNTEFIARSPDGSALILQRVKDGYINATALCKAAGKLYGHYRENGNTDAFFSALVADIGIPMSELTEIRRGGNPQEQGTWVHPQVAVHLAQWASPEFAVQVSRWVYDWMRGEMVERPKPTDSPFELIMRQAGAALELERRQMVLDHRQTQLETKQTRIDERVENMEVKIAAWVGGEDCFTVKAFARLQGVPMPKSLAIALGKEATRMCKERGFPTGTVRDEVHGSVNTYPEEILSIVFFHQGLLRGGADA